MADLSGVHFEYAGTSSRLYGLITANVETTRFTKVAGDISGVTIYNKKNRKRYLIDDDQSNSPISFELDIVTDDGRCLEFNECRQVEKWLFNRGRYKKFYIDIEDDCTGETTELINGVQKRLYMNGRFINPERLEYNGGIVGYKATFETDSCMWWQEPVTQVFEIGTQTIDATSNFTVNVDTDLDDYVYPKLKIYGGNTEGVVTLINTTDSDTRRTAVTLPIGGYVYINSEINLIDNGMTGIYQTMTQKNFPRLLDGPNVFTVEGCVNRIEIEFQNRRNI